MARSRASLMGQYHEGAKRLFGDDDETRRTHLERETGHRSAKDCTDAQLADAIRSLRAAGAYDGRARGGTGADRPTSRQWAALAALARARGWTEGLEDARTQAFCEHTAKVSSTRFLTRAGITACITGLDRWKNQAAIHAVPTVPE